MSSLHENLKSLRYGQRLTQKQVADEIGISQGNYSAIESGKIEPSLSTLYALATFFGETLDTLTDFVQVVGSYHEDTVDEREIVEAYRGMDIVEKNLFHGIIDVIQKQSKDKMCFLPRDFERAEEKNEFINELNKKE